MNLNDQTPHRSPRHDHTGRQVEERNVPCERVSLMLCLVFGITGSAHDTLASVCILVPIAVFQCITLVPLPTWTSEHTSGSLDT